ncbi:tripartite tricarboxylate transporter TctB family protein [Salinarimonas sp.]|uniref:tripartite tricarboxylate transporter TctB family protein n=1 Tax=Salinarimonas sp. TaxID=2766526 RepID=UPI0032D8C25B
MTPPSDTRPRALRPGELGVALVLVVFAGVAFWRAAEISGFGSLTSGGVFPMLAAAVMIASGLAILRDAWRRRGGEGLRPLAVLAYLAPARLVAFLALVALYAAAIPQAGFVAASAAFVFVSVAFLWRRGIVWAAVIAAVSVAALWHVFRVAFQVVLPTGSFWQ